MSIVIILTGPGNPPPPPPPPGGRVAGEDAPDSLINAMDGEIVAVFHDPNAVRKARKYLKALEDPA